MFIYPAIYYRQCSRTIYSLKNLFLSFPTLLFPQMTFSLSQRGTNNYRYLFSSFSSEFGLKFGRKATVHKQNADSWQGYFSGETREVQSLHFSPEECRECVIFWISHIISCLLAVTFNPQENYEEEHEAMSLTSILMPIFWIAHIIPCLLVVTVNPQKNYEEEHKAMSLSNNLCGSFGFLT